MTPGRIPCRAVFLDAGGVIVLPNRELLAGALSQVGIDIDPAAVSRAHYRAVRVLDRAGATATATRAGYPGALLPELRIVPGRTAEAIGVWERLADRTRSEHVLWSEPTPGARETIAALKRAGIAVLIVTNSDGHGEENLRASGFADVPVIDSTVVGTAKPDPRIFQIALARAGVSAAETVHVGDALINDVAGAHAAGVAPIHFDPLRACRAADHRHIRTLRGIWRHVAPPAPSRPPAGSAGAWTVRDVRT
jgi:putative hydrolase of the HAD superfamily